MTGREIAWRTLAGERVATPCIVGDWIFNPRFWPAVTGRRLSEAVLPVAVEAFRRVGANLTPQFAVGEQERFYAGRSQNALPAFSAEQVRAQMESAAESTMKETEFDLAAAAQAYARPLREFQAAAGDDILRIAHFSQVDFMGGYSRWGYEGYLEALALYPEVAEAYFASGAHKARLENLAIAEAVRKFGLAPFVYGGQDLCFNAGPLCSPRWLREHYFPHLARALQPLHDAKIRIIWHCDGDIRSILPDLLGLGVWGFQGFQEETGTTLELMAQQRTLYGTRPVLLGSVSVTSTLPYGTVEDVKREVERCFRVAGSGGGFALAPSSSIMPEVPVENILAMFEHARTIGPDFLRPGAPA